MKPILDLKEIHKVEMWLVELKVMLECEAKIQAKDMKNVYLNKAKEIEDFLNNR